MSKTSDGRKASLGGGERYSVIGGAAIALLFSLAIGTVLILLSAVTLFFVPRGAMYISTLGTVLGLLTALLGGILAGRLNRHAGALSGLLFGVFYLGVMLLLGRFFYTGAPFVKRLLGYILFPASALVGGALGGMRRTRARHKRRRR